MRDVVALSKPRIVLMSALMAGLGMFLAPASLSLGLSVSALLGVSLAVAAANALNMYLERDLDRAMARTRNRPLPAGRMSPAVALQFGLLCALGSIMLLWTQVNPPTAILAAVATAFYVLLYTPLKRRTHLALYVGTLPGAAPPLLGWVAATGAIDPGALALFALMVVWQIPHFHAIALFRRSDYDNARLPITPSVSGERTTQIQAAVTASALVPLGLLLAPLGAASWPAAIVVAVLGLLFALHGIAGLAGADSAGKTSPAQHGRAFFVSSLIYLPLVCAALVAGGLLS